MLISFTTPAPRPYKLQRVREVGAGVVYIVYLM